MEEFSYVPNFSVRLGSRQAKDIVSDFNDGTYFIPDTQREFSYNAWQKTAVITSIIRGLSIDTITIVQQSFEGDKYSICDGAHRVRVLAEFLSGGFVMQVDPSVNDGLNRLNGMYFEQLPKKIQSTIKRKEIQIVTIVPNEFKESFIKEAEVAVVIAKNSCAIRMPQAQKELFRSSSRNEDVLFIKRTVSELTNAVFGGVAQKSAISLALNSAGASKMIGLSTAYARFVTSRSRESFKERFDYSIRKEFANRLEKGNAGNYQVILGCVSLSILFALFSDGDESSLNAMRDIAADNRKYKGKTLQESVDDIICGIQGRSRPELKYARLANSDSNNVFAGEKSRPGTGKIRVRNNVYLTNGEIDDIRGRFNQYEGEYDRILDKLSDYKDENRIYDNEKTSSDYAFIVRKFGYDVEGEMDWEWLQNGDDAEHVVQEILRQDSRVNSQGKVVVE